MSGVGMSSPKAVRLSTTLLPKPAKLSSKPSPPAVLEARKIFPPKVVGIFAGEKNVLDPMPKTRSDASSVSADP